MASIIGSGLAGIGVLARTRWVSSWPWTTSTSAALMPLPPMSTPIAWKPSITVASE